MIYDYAFVKKPNWIQEYLVNPVLDVAMSFLDFHGFGIPLCIGICIVLMAMKKTRRYGYMLLMALAISILLNYLIKIIIARPRPFLEYNFSLLIDPPHSFSFPSGHTQQSFVVATILLFVNKKAGIVGYIIAACIGFSRMYLLVHYPSDVLIGAILGIACGFFTRWLFNRFIKRSHNKNLFIGR